MKRKLLMLGIGVAMLAGMCSCGPMMGGPGGPNNPGISQGPNNPGNPNNPNKPGNPNRPGNQPGQRPIAW
ncbi:MAG: hypothetical protein LIP03_12035 [Bacteroidales bacterium]|nr:hypothetical protein [Bacteroidales bacterium]